MTDLILTAADRARFDGQLSDSLDFALRDLASARIALGAGDLRAVRGLVASAGVCIDWMLQACPWPEIVEQHAAAAAPLVAESAELLASVAEVERQAKRALRARVNASLKAARARELAG